MAAKPLKILNWNAHSVRVKKIELMDFIRSHEIDICILTETYLSPSVSFSVPDFSTIRLDRTQSRGGGVAILVKKGIKFFILPHPNTSVIESLAIEVETSSGNLRIYAVYCPRQCVDSNGSSRLFKNDLQKLTRHRSKFVIGGDLNARHELWRNNHRNKNGTLLFDDVQIGYYSIYHPDEPTFLSPAGVSSTLDIFLSNVSISKPITYTELGSDHYPVVCEFGGDVTKIPQQQRKDFHRVNWVTFQRIVDSHLVDSQQLNTIEDIDTAINSFCSSIENADRICIRRVPVRGKFIELDSHTKYLIRLRNIFRRQFQRTGMFDKKEHVSALYVLIQAKVESLKNDSFSRDIQNLENYSKPF